MSAADSAPIDFYDATIGVVDKALTSLHNILTKATKSPDAATFIEGRLAPDMHPLSFQVRTTCNLTSHLLVNVVGTTAIELPDDWKDLKTLDDAIALVDKSQAILRAVDRAAFLAAGRDTVPAEINIPTVGVWKLTGKTYALHYILPNVFFHVQTAYAILRNKGLDLGKADYIGAFIGVPTLAA